MNITMTTEAVVHPENEEVRIDSGGNAWTALSYFNLYRITIASLFAGLGVFGKLPPNFAEFDVKRFTIAAMVYLLCAGLSQVALIRRFGPYRFQVYAAVMVDIVAITVFTHTSGGIAGGFGILLVVSVAGACLLIRGTLPILFAAIATIAVLLETFYGVTYFDYPIASYTQAALLGAALFGSAFLASLLAEQARRSELLAAERAVDIENLSRLNEYIVERMRSGILVLDEGALVVHINEAARSMVGVEDDFRRSPLSEFSKPLDEAHQAWLETRVNSKSPLQVSEQGQAAMVSFTALGADGYGGTLVFLEDAAEMQQRAQQLKLASLGRLTASIAHEIRNPLGAISHAGQLLGESPGIPEQDKRLTEIISEHSVRMNDIIENVMSIGRRDTTIGESFDLLPWLDGFIEELKTRKGFDDADIEKVWLAGDIVVRMDKSQLHQVLWNLCENGLRYSQNKPLLRFESGIIKLTGRPFVDIADSGPGMDPETADQAFEPFFTGESKGTGLGLYIARELCESNQASLMLMNYDEHGCRFRIRFAHPDRQQLEA